MKLHQIYKHDDRCFSKEGKRQESRFENFQQIVEKESAFDSKLQLIKKKSDIEIVSSSLFNNW